METIKIAFFKKLDEKSKEIAKCLTRGEAVTPGILKTIAALYKAAQCETHYKTHDFESAYHNPITAELEFYIARILFHYGKMSGLQWKIFLRRQQKKTAPDIRIEVGDKTIAILEIKAKAGWMQPFLSSDRFEHDMKRLKRGDSDFDPNILIEKHKKQLDKYARAFKLKPDNVYLFLPALTMVHRKSYDKKLRDYYNHFQKTSGLSKNNLILLSENLLLDLADLNKSSALQPTDRFEKLVKKLARKSKAAKVVDVKTVAFAK